jgi:hypothetical protein
MPGSSKWAFPSYFKQKSSVMRAICTATSQPPWLNHSNNILCLQILKLCALQTESSCDCKERQQTTAVAGDRVLRAVAPRTLADNNWRFRGLIRPDNGKSNLWNVSEYLPDYKAPWEPEISPVTGTLFNS